MGNLFSAAVGSGVFGSLAIKHKLVSLETEDRVCRLGMSCFSINDLLDLFVFRLTSANSILSGRTYVE